VLRISRAQFRELLHRAPAADGAAVACNAVVHSSAMLAE
jgi:hypothetical protein